MGNEHNGQHPNSRAALKAHASAAGEARWKRVSKAKRRAHARKAAMARWAKAPAARPGS